MPILVTGANGFLGYYLVRQLLEKAYPVVATGKGPCRLPFLQDPNFQYAEMDFTQPFEVHDVLERFQPAVLVHAGAMSKPDSCELQQWQAYLVNVEGTLNLLLAAEAYKSFFILLSTDFVFDGKKGMYREEDSPGPVNFYGRTKLEAEEATREYPHQWAITRTILVYGKPAAGGSNILSTVQEKLKKGETYSVVDDQLRTPTYVEDLASGLIAVIEKKTGGMFHLGGPDILTPYQMALRTADHLGLDRSLVKRVTAASFSQPAQRPLQTGFIIDKAKRELGFSPLSFEEGLRKTFPGQHKNGSPP